MAQWQNKNNNDEWYTPKYVFDALECSFDLDVASPKDRSFCHVPANNFITENSLDIIWNGFCWMNPPFSGKGQKCIWLNKIWEHGNGIALTPDRTSTEWWHEAAEKSDIILFVKNKIKFIRPDGTLGKQPGNGTTLFAYGEKAISALLKAEQNKLGTILSTK